MLSESQFKRIIYFLYDRAGLVIKDSQLEQLKVTLSRVFQTFNLESYDQAIESLSGTGLSQQPLERAIVDAVTTGESYFFRDQKFFDYLRWHHIPPMIVEKVRSQQKNLRVWSAGCSCGQEIYSIAILLSELIQDQRSWNIDLIGTDICTERIEYAKRAKYDSWSLRVLDNAVTDRYFQRREEFGAEVFDLQADIRRRVRFDYLNLLDNGYPSVILGLQNVDLIICKNVFIYLEKSRIPEILERMYRTLSAEGVIVMTPSDYTASACEGLFEATLTDGFYYLRKVAEFSGQHDQSNLAGAAAINCCRPAASSQQACGELTFAKYDKYQELEVLIESGDWENVLAFCESLGELQSIEQRLAHINALANLGQVDAALNYCDTIKDEFKDNKNLHLMRGILLASVKRVDEASKCFSLCVYLDPLFVEAHYQRGLLLLTTGKTKQARACLELASKAYQKVLLKQKQLLTVLHPRAPLSEVHAAIQSYLHNIAK